MGDELDDFVGGLQDKINRETEERYGKVAFDRWQDPRYIGALAGHNGRADTTGQCGDMVEMYVKVEDGRLADASFLTDGCMPTVVCSSLAIEMAVGRGLGQVMEITGDTILARLEGLPNDHEHCAHLAAQALHEALEDYLNKRTQNRFDPYGGKPGR
ncbi:MAG: iron-sulfur cluster assembly scaffold protein [Proteobacteria bacterium]|nr:iron-sulfur cluster assembly scaffold protein [Pseudomonadota bacterium]